MISWVTKTVDMMATDSPDLGTMVTSASQVDALFATLTVKVGHPLSEVAGVRQEFVRRLAGFTT
jgi:hypothetical protein